jgi:drug/metabolite transporter (DMT)-like permease
MKFEVFAKKYLGGLQPLIIAFWQTFLGAVFAIPISMALEYNQVSESHTTWKGWLGVIFQAIGSVWIGFMIYFYLLQRIGLYSSWFHSFQRY